MYFIFFFLIVVDFSNNSNSSVIIFLFKMLSNTHGLSSKKRFTEVEKHFSGKLLEILENDLKEQSGDGFRKQDVITSQDKWFHCVGGQKRANPDFNDVLTEGPKEQSN